MIPVPEYLNMRNYKFKRPGAGNLVYGRDAEAWHPAPPKKFLTPLRGFLRLLTVVLVSFYLLMKV